MDNVVSIPVAVVILGLFFIAPFARGSPLALEDSDLEYDTRQLNGGLNRVYMPEYKRLPVYDFGLGKRSEVEDRSGNWKYDDYPYNEDEEDSVPDLELYHDDDMQSIDKRRNLYNFGLGKRQRYDFGLGKRGHKYDFGLGKKSLPAVHRDKIFNMGLGKRNRYSFGLGKRPYNLGPIGSRFNFGLGKRSNDYDVSKNLITKREVHEKSPSKENFRNEGEATKVEKANKTAEVESHEVMKHPERADLSKRSSNDYASSGESNRNYRKSAAFSRQFRKPLYNFGLGKRTFSSNESSLKKI